MDTEVVRLLNSNAIVAKPGYKAQAEDTSIETDLFEFHLLRQRTNSDRYQMAQSHTQMVRRLSLSGIRHRFPELQGSALARKVAEVFLGDCYDGIYIPQGNPMTWIQDSLALAAILHPIFEQAGISYYITGGVASSTFGDPRATRDLDIVMAVQWDQLDRLVQALEVNGFYVPGVDDIRSGRMQTLGVTHQETIARADLIVAGTEDFDREKFARRRQIEILGSGTFYFASPEDVVLNKLRWGKKSQSEKQWRDVLGVLKVQGETLDFDYLLHWANQLDLTDDLAQAMTEAGL
jgi:hypothetical protein